jgi:hypothetical protein
MDIQQVQIKYKQFYLKWIVLSGIHKVENYINFTRTDSTIPEL